MIRMYGMPVEWYDGRNGVERETGASRSIEVDDNMRLMMDALLS